MAKRTSAFGPTQKEIADALGIAQTTVALALNPKYQSRYSASTVKRIQEKAEELGYRPNRFAQIMRSNRSHTVGIIVSSGVYESSRNKLIELISAFEEQGYAAVVADIDWFKGSLDLAMLNMLDHSIEGAVFLNLSVTCDESSPGFKAFKTRNIPAVETNCNTHFGFTRVEEDITKAFFDLTTHHLQQGARNPVLVLNQRDPKTAFQSVPGHTIKRRIVGFASAVYAAGGSLDVQFSGPSLDEWIKAIPAAKSHNEKIRALLYAPLSMSEWKNTFEVGRGIAKRLLESPQPPDSFLCANDDLAIGTLKACEQAGIDVPGEVLVSGYDSSAVSAYVGVPLTTVSAHNRAIAKASARLLIEQIEAKTILKPEEPLRIPGEIIFRESSNRSPKITRAATVTSLPD